MDEDFWLDKWRAGEIGFHEAAPHPLLTRHWPALGLSAGERVFVPLCGKSLDLHWLLAQGFAVAGAELSRIAVEHLFAELGLVPAITPQGSLERFEAAGLTVFAGNVFDLTSQVLGPVGAVYDRAALIALPAPVREAYAPHVTLLASGAPQVLVSLAYDPALRAGPPFSVPAEEIHRLYGGAYALKEAERRATSLRGGVPASESVWILRPRAPLIESCPS